MEELYGLRQLFERGRDISLYNALTGKIDKTRFRDNIEVFINGPVVYRDLYVEDLRTYIFTDTFCRFLNLLGHHVHIILGADDTKGSYNFSYKMLFNSLNMIDMTSVYVSSVREESIAIIDSLLKRGYAYVSGNGIYLDTSKIPEYRIAHSGVVKTNLDMYGDSANKKRNDSDFILLLLPYNLQAIDDNVYKDGAINLSVSNFALSVKHNGYLLDLYCDSECNVFSHILGSLAICKAYSGNFWCEDYLHVTPFKSIDRPSKLYGIEFDDYIEGGYHPLALRLFFLKSHYRKVKIIDSKFFLMADEFNLEYQRLLRKVETIKREFYNDERNRQTMLIEYDHGVLKFMKRFVDALGNDFNTPDALRVLYDVVDAPKMLAAKKLYLIEQFDDVLGLDLLKRLVRN